MAMRVELALTTDCLSDIYPIAAGAEIPATEGKVHLADRHKFLLLLVNSFRASSTDALKLQYFMPN
jgi:hypothetical protein